MTKFSASASVVADPEAWTTFSVQRDPGPRTVFEGEVSKPHCGGEEGSPMAVDLHFGCGRQKMFLDSLGISILKA